MSFSTLRKEEEKSQSITLPVLLTGLSELVEWEAFGSLLGVPIRDIDRIKVENSASLHSMVLHLLDHLINHIKDLSWKKIIEALEKIPKEKNLAEKLSKIHLQPQVVNSCQKIISLKEEEEFAVTFDNILKIFASLVLNIEKALKNEADFDDVLSFATNYLRDQFQPQPLNIRQLFNCLQPYYCFISYKILKVIVSMFVEEAMENNNMMRKYHEALTKWLKSTTVKEFKETVEKAASTELTEVVNPSPNQCLIVLRLEGEWLKVTLNHLWRLLEHLFGKESSILTRLRIKEGSVVVCFFAPQSEILSLLAICSKRFNDLVCFGIQSIQFGNILLVAPQLDVSNAFVYKFELGLEIAIRFQNNALVTRWFLDLGVDPNEDLDMFHLTPANETDKNVVFTPLMCASANNNTEIMSLLVKYGANIHRFNESGFSAIHIAAVFGSVDAIEYLLKKSVSPDQYIMPGKMAPLSIASHFQNIEVVLFLLNHGAKIDFQDKEGFTALTGVCLRGMYAMAKLLLEKGANPNLQTNEGGTPLALTCQQDHEFKEIVKLLLDFGADPNIPTFDGTTPLMRASSHQNHQIVKLLLQAGVPVNTTNNSGMTALHIACSNNDIQLVNILLAANADVNVQNSIGQTPLQYACDRGNAKVVQCLLVKKADPNLSSNKGCSPLHVVTQNNNVKIATILLDAGADPNIADGKLKITPLHLACVHSSDELVRLLLKANANVNVVTTKNHTPLSIAAQRGRMKVAEMLLSKGADIEPADSCGWTPIFYAAAGGQLDMIRLLLKHGAKIKKDKFGETIESVAAKVGGIKIKSLLQEAIRTQREKKDEATVSKEQERKDKLKDVTSTALTTPIEVDTESSEETTKPSPALMNEDDQQSTDNSYMYSHYQNFLYFISSSIGSIKQQYDNSIKRLQNQMEAMQFTIAKQQKLFSIN